MNGHWDVLVGVTSCKNIEDYNQIKSFIKDFGSLIAPMDAFLWLWGVKTLPLEVHMQNGIKVAKFLKIKKVNHPWLESFKVH